MRSTDFRRLYGTVRAGSLTLTDSQRRRLRALLDEPPPCHYCGGPGTTRDHVVPKALGGPTKPWNLVPACPTCNRRKAANVPTCPCGTCTVALARVLGAGPLTEESA